MCLVNLAKEGSCEGWLNHAAIASGVVPFFPLRSSSSFRAKGRMEKLNVYDLDFICDF